MDPHSLPLTILLAQAAGTPGLPALSSVSFVDPNFGIFGIAHENDKHPPTDIQRRQAFVSTVVNALRQGPYRQDTVIFITYDEHGGYYDHVASPAARQGFARTPDGISPGQSADLSNPPLSLQPGGGAECSKNLLSATNTSVNDAAALCPDFSADPTGPFPAYCASFDQLGVRVPFLAISPSSKQHCDHTSILAFIEKRFLSSGSPDGDDDSDDLEGTRQFVTQRDKHAHRLEDMFDFDRAPSANTTISVAAPPAQDCAPK